MRVWNERLDKPSASQRIADVAGDRSDIGPAAAIDLELKMRPCVVDNGDPVDPHEARGRLDRLAGSRQVVGPPALNLDGGIRRQAADSRCPISEVWPAGSRLTKVSRAMPRHRFDHRHRACRYALPGGSTCDMSWASRADSPPAWWRRRRTRSESRSPADRACPHDPPWLVATSERPGRQAFAK